MQHQCFQPIIIFSLLSLYNFITPITAITAITSPFLQSVLPSSDSTIENRAPAKISGFPYQTGNCRLGGSSCLAFPTNTLTSGTSSNTHFDIKISQKFESPSSSRNYNARFRTYCRLWCVRVKYCS